MSFDDWVFTIGAIIVIVAVIATICGPLYVAIAAIRARRKR